MKRLIISLLFVTVSYATVINVPADYSTIQGGIDAASDNDTVLVAAGTYIENLIWENKNISIISVAGPENTIIDGNASADTLGPVCTVSNVNFNGDDVYDVMDGFTLKNGKGSDYVSAGGLKINYSSVTFKNLIIKENQSSEISVYSGAIVFGGSPRFINCSVVGNNDVGLMVSGYQSKPYFNNVIFSDHDSSSAIMVYDSGIEMDSCQIIHNDGGGLRYTGVGFNGSIITNTLFAFNGSSDSGIGALSVVNSGQELVLDHCTFYGNSKEQQFGEDLYSNGTSWNDYQGNNIHVSNTIFVNHSDSENASIYVERNEYLDTLQFSNCLFSYEDFVGANDATNHYVFTDNYYNENPEFCDIYSNDFTLAENSPAVGAGDGGSNIGAFGVGCTEALSLIGTLPIPSEYNLMQNYPNPFNPVTTLHYNLPENSYVNVTVYDMLGREVKTLVNGTQEAGLKSIVWDAINDKGNPVSAGVYLYQIQAGEFIQTRKMVLLK